MLTVETAEDDEEILNVYAYDLDKEASQKIFSVSCSASHPAAVYDAVNQYVYYSGKTREKLYHDQLIRVPSTQWSTPFSSGVNVFGCVSILPSSCR